MPNKGDKMKSKAEIKVALKAVHKGNPVEGLDPRVQFHIGSHKWHNPSQTGTGFEQALIWVLDLDKDNAKLVKLLEIDYEHSYSF